MKIISVIQLFIVLLPFGMACNNSGGGGKCDDKTLTCIVITLVVIIVLGFITNFIISIIIYIFIQRLKWNIDEIYNMGDEYANEIIKSIYDNNSYNYSFALWIMIALTIMLFCGIISLMIYCKYNRSHLKY